MTGDGQVTLNWLANTETDLSGYRLYASPCSNGPSCPYDRIGATATTQYVAGGLANGVTRFYAISAVDKAGNESDLSFEDVFDTPRPAGSTTLHNYQDNINGTGWDFSAFAHVSSISPPTDMFYGNNGAVAQMFCTRCSSRPDIREQRHPGRRLLLEPGCRGLSPRARTPAGRPPAPSS